MNRTIESRMWVGPHKTWTHDEYINKCISDWITDCLRDKLREGSKMLAERLMNIYTLDIVERDAFDSGNDLIVALRLSKTPDKETLESFEKEYRQALRKGFAK